MDEEDEEYLQEQRELGSNNNIVNNIENPPQKLISQNIPNNQQTEKNYNKKLMILKMRKIFFIHKGENKAINSKIIWKLFLSY